MSVDVPRENTSMSVKLNDLTRARKSGHYRIDQLNLETIYLDIHQY